MRRGTNFATRVLYRNFGLLFGLAMMAFGFWIYFFLPEQIFKGPDVFSYNEKVSYWMMLHRKSNVEYLYLGVPGDTSKSSLIYEMKVKTGISGERPTPLPELLDREYWVITGKVDSSDNPETAPYFLALNIPISDREPFGPEPYMECDGQCSWALPGEFGLHGINGNEYKLTKEDPGSSGCIRHSDRDIGYLYQLLNPEADEIRYYVKDL